MEMKKLLEVLIILVRHVAGDHEYSWGGIIRGLRAPICMRAGICIEMGSGLTI